MIQTEDYKRELIEIFFVQRKVIFAVTAMIFVLSVLIAFFWPPTYSATGSILVRNKEVEKSPSALEEVDTQITRFELSKEDLSSEIETLTSPTVIQRAIKHIQDNNLFAEPKPTKAEKVIGFLKKPFKYFIKRKAPVPFLEEIYAIKGSLSTQLIPASNVIKVTLYRKAPNEAVILLNALLDQYRTFRTDIHNPAKQAFF